MPKKVTIQIGQYELRFIFKAIALALTGKTMNHRDTQYMTKLGDKLYVIYKQTYGEEKNT